MTARIKNKYIISYIILISIILLEIDIGGILLFDVSVNRLVGLILLLFIGLAGVANNVSKAIRIGWSGPTKYYSMYIGWIILSLIWADNYVESMSAVIGILFIYLFIIGYRRINTEVVSHCFIVISLVIAIISWLILFLSYDYAVDNESIFRLKGVMTHSQRLALLASIGMILSLIKMLNRSDVSIKKNYLYSISFLFLFITLVSTQTRAFTTVAILVCVLIYMKSINLRAKIIFIYLFILVSFVLGSALFEHYYSRGDSDIIELTGRLGLWNLTFEYILQKPILGYGFGSFKYTILESRAWLPDQAHNMLIHSVFETGIIGVVLLLLFLMKSFQLSNKLENVSLMFNYTKYILLFIIIASLTGNLIGSTITIPYALLLLLIVRDQKMIKYCNRKHENFAMI